MAKITDLAIVAAITGDEFLPIVQGGATKRATMSALRALIVPFLQAWYKGDPGNPGPAGNVALTVAQLRAAPTTNATMIAAYDGTGSTMTWTDGNFAAVAARAPADYVQANGIPLTAGAWVRLGAASIAYREQEANARQTSIDARLRDLPRSPRAFDSFADALASENGVHAPSGIFPAATSLKPLPFSTVKGAGRERTFVRTSGSRAAFDSTANFVTYKDQTIDRSDGVGGVGINHWSRDNAVGPLEGFKILRCNVNGHDYGVDLRDPVMASIEDSYIQACKVGLKITNTGPNAATVVGLRQAWIRGNSIVGLDMENVVNVSIDQVAFESGPKGASFRACSDLLLLNSWWESLALGAEFVNCRSIGFCGLSVDGAVSGDRFFYFVGSAAIPCHVIFDGPVRIENLGSKILATADTGVTISVRNPLLRQYAWQAVNGGQVHFDFTLKGRAPWTPGAIAAGSRTPGFVVNVPGARPGDFCQASFVADNASSDPQNLGLTAGCYADDQVLVVGFDANGAGTTQTAGKVTVLVTPRPYIS